MVSTRSMERMSEADQIVLLLSLQREMVETKRKVEEVTKKNEQEIQAPRTENEDMRKKLVEGGPSARPMNVVGRSFTSPPSSRVVEETKDKAPTHEMDGESCLNKSARTSGTLDSVRRHPFTNAIIEASLPDKWKGFNRDRYDKATDPDEHMDTYTMLEYMTSNKRGGG